MRWLACTQAGAVVEIFRSWPDAQGFAWSHFLLTGETLTVTDERTD